MKLPSIFKNKESQQVLQLQWPSCNHPKTQSFRADKEIFKTVNSIYFDPLDLDASDETSQLESWFTNSSSESSSFSGTESNEEFDECVEMIIRGVRSDRLFFEPEDTSSVMEVEEEEEEDNIEDENEESVVLAMESEDPYLDFKKSMEEMVEMHEIIYKLGVFTRNVGMVFEDEWKDESWVHCGSICRFAYRTDFFSS